MVEGSDAEEEEHVVRSLASPSSRRLKYFSTFMFSSAFNSEELACARRSHFSALLRSSLNP